MQEAIRHIAQYSGQKHAPAKHRAWVGFVRTQQKVDDANQHTRECEEKQCILERTEGRAVFVKQR